MERWNETQENESSYKTRQQQQKLLCCSRIFLHDNNDFRSLCSTKQRKIHRHCRHSALRDTSREHLITWTWEFLCCTDDNIVVIFKSHPGVVVELFTVCSLQTTDIQQRWENREKRILSSQWDRWTSPSCQRHHSKMEKKCWKMVFIVLSQTMKKV